MLTNISSPSVFIYEHDGRIDFRRNDQKPPRGARLVAVTSITAIGANTTVLVPEILPQTLEDDAVTWLDRELSGPNRARALAATGFATIAEQRIYSTGVAALRYQFNRLVNKDRATYQYSLGWDDPVVALAALAHRTELAGGAEATVIASGQMHKKLASHWHWLGADGPIRLHVITAEAATRRTDWMAAAQFLLVKLGGAMRRSGRAKGDILSPHIRTAVDAAQVVYVTAVSSLIGTCQIRDLTAAR